MTCITNYYSSIFLTDSSSKPFEVQMLTDQVFTLDHNMKYYSISDDRIGLLFSDALDKVKDKLEN